MREELITRKQINTSVITGKDKFMALQLEKYLSTIQDQEFLTKYLKNKRLNTVEKSLIAIINVDCILPMLRI